MCAFSTTKRKLYLKLKLKAQDQKIILASFKSHFFFFIYKRKCFKKKNMKIFQMLWEIVNSRVNLVRFINFKKILRSFNYWKFSIWLSDFGYCLKFSIVKIWEKQIFRQQLIYIHKGICILYIVFCVYTMKSLLVEVYG